MPAPSHRVLQRRQVRRIAWATGIVAMVAVASPFVVQMVASESPTSSSAAGSIVADPGNPGIISGTTLRSARDLRGRRVAPLSRLADRVADQPVKFKVLKAPMLKLVPPPPPPPQSFSFRIGTFNVLGSQHTTRGGDRKGFPPASSRTAGAAGLVAKHGVDVLGTQELQDDQLRQLQGATGMAAYPGFAWGVKETDNSILWDPNVFELVSASQFNLTFMSRSRPQPIVRLRHRATGREIYVVNTHPSAGGGVYAGQRRAGQGALVSIVRSLSAQGIPIFVTGDMNDRQAFYCNVVPSAGLSAPNGGSYASGCRPPPSPLPVDWVVGRGASWSGYWRDTAPVDRRISDHFFISATANVA